MGLLAAWGLLLTMMIAAKAAVNLAPDERIARTLVSSVEKGQWDLEALATGYGSALDRYTECAAFSLGMGNAPGLTNRWEYAAADLHLASAGCAPMFTALQSVQVAQYAEAQPYYRYWHGYTLLTRPALAYLDVPSLRLISALLLFGTLAWLLSKLWRAFGPLPAAGFAIPLLATMDLLVLPESVPHATTWTVILGSGVLLLGASRGGAWPVAYAAMLAGALFAFFDFLTNPPAAVMLGMFTTLMGSLRLGRRPVSALRLVLIAGTVWSVAYLVTWAAKWAISALFFGPTAVAQNIRGAVSFRLNGTNELVSSNFGAASAKNLTFWTQQWSLSLPLIVLCLLVTVACGLWVIRAWGPLTGYLATLIAVSLVPLPWYEVLKNHSQIHAWFTYRSLAMSLACLTSGAIALALEVRSARSIPDKELDQSVTGAAEGALAPLGRN